MDEKMEKQGSGNTDLVLASSSPRRKELLKEVTSKYDIIHCNINEKQTENEGEYDYVLRNSKEKCRSVSRKCQLEGRPAWVLAGDTIVVLDHTVMGKPGGEEEARGMLQKLQARRHEVITGICLMHWEKEICFHEAVRTSVWMRPVRSEEIDAYVRSGEPFDKAGAYAIEGGASGFIEKIEGSYSNVVGLPLERLREVFQLYGIT